MRDSSFRIDTAPVIMQSTNAIHSSIAKKIHQQSQTPFFIYISVERAFDNTHYNIKKKYFQKCLCWMRMIR